VGDEAVEKVAMLLEQLSSRFELVVEVAEGFSGKLQAMHEEMVSQISEVGKQIRFLSDQIGDNRARLTAVRSDLATEMVRLNEALGATRVQIREDIAGFAELKGSLNRAGGGDRALQAEVGKEIGERLSQARGWFTEELDQRIVQLRQEIGRGLAQAADHAQGGAAAAGAEGLAAEVRNEVKATHKALTGLAKKFERFDDKMSVQVKDHDQRLRKLERSARG
jgi:uncharacterized small protein (DUF1192 family)